MPDPASEQGHPDHIRLESHNLGKDAIIVQVEVAGGSIEDPNLVARTEKRSQHVLLTQQGRSEALWRGRVEQQDSSGPPTGGCAHRQVIFTGPSSVSPETTGPTGM